MSSQVPKKNSMFQFLDEQVPGIPSTADILIKEPREPAKSRDPNYSKLGVYLRKETHREARVKALSQGLELSDLVEALLREWLAKQQG